MSQLTNEILSASDPIPAHVPSYRRVAPITDPVPPRMLRQFASAVIAASLFGGAIALPLLDIDAGTFFPRAFGLVGPTAEELKPTPEYYAALAAGMASDAEEAAQNFVAAEAAAK